MILFDGNLPEVQLGPFVAVVADAVVVVVVAAAAAVVSASSVVGWCRWTVSVEYIKFHNGDLNAKLHNPSIH